MSGSGIVGRYRFTAGTHEFEKDRVFVNADEHDEANQSQICRDLK